MGPTHLEGDKSSPIYRDFEPWLNAIDKEHRRSLIDHEFSPLHQHEQCAVSFLAYCAAKASYPAYVEVELEKKGKTGRCRADLWLICGSTHYWFEFKRSGHDLRFKKWNLQSSLALAEDEIGSLYFDEHEVGFGGVIGCTRDRIDLQRQDYRNFAESVDFSFRFGPDDDDGAYLYLKTHRAKK